MLITILASVVLAQGQVPPHVEKPISAPELVSKMLAHYSSAKSVVGTITLTQSARNVSITITTELQFDRPSKMYLVQTMSSPNPGRWFLNSNGKTFRYSKPENVIGPDVLREYVDQHGTDQDIGMLYSAVRLSLKDPNAPLEVAIGRKADLQALMAQWATLSILRAENVGDVAATVVGGSYRIDSAHEPSGNYRAYIDKDFNLLRYEVKENFGVPGQNQVVTVDSIWNSTLKVDAKTDPSLYSG